MEQASRLGREFVEDAALVKPVHNAIRRFLSQLRMRSF